jgi:hypothetical protein
MVEGVAPANRKIGSIPAWRAHERTVPARVGVGRGQGAPRGVTG